MGTVATGRVLVVSRDEDFAQTLVDHIREELELACDVVAGNEGVLSMNPDAALVVTTEASGESRGIPVLRVQKKPLRLQEVLDEIDAMLHKQSPEEVVLGKECRLRPRLKQLIHVASGKALNLTDKEVQLLLCLNEAAGKSVGKEQLLRQVWSIESVLDTHTLETHIYRLRSKCRDLTGDDTMIAAVDGGYAWLGK